MITTQHPQHKTHHNIKLIKIIIYREIKSTQTQQTHTHTQQHTHAHTYNIIIACNT